MSEKAKQLDELMPLMRERLAAGQTVAFSPKGTSMLPVLRNGKDIVELSSLQGKLRKYDLPLYQRDNGQYVLHRVVAVAGETYTCCGDNQLSVEKGVRHDQMIALVTAFVRDGKRVEVTSLRYRLYCRFWVGIRPLRCWRCQARTLLKRIFRRSLS